MMDAVFRRVISTERAVLAARGQEAGKRAQDRQRHWQRADKTGHAEKEPAHKSNH
ncbi:hypothetical protein [Xanthobacter autotrophicus]|uniref:hypothetical protein n=1 Tax=Xanthobacter autotrophicus TaxID=280 RepID=UPI003727FC26